MVNQFLFLPLGATTNKTQRYFLNNKFLPIQGWSCMFLNETCTLYFTAFFNLIQITSNVFVKMATRNRNFPGFSEALGWCQCEFKVHQMYFSKLILVYYPVYYIIYLGFCYTGCWNLRLQVVFRFQQLFACSRYHQI